MHSVLYVIRLLYRKRWLLLTIPLIVAMLVFLLISAQPNKYKSTTTIYTGIMSGYDVLSATSGVRDLLSVNNSIANIISIVKSESTLEDVFLKLMAQDLTHIDIREDTNYMTASSSRELAIETPPEVFHLVVPGSVDSTYANLRNYYESSSNNYLKQIFHWKHHHYSYEVLSTVDVTRVSNSDMLSISYENDDQYIVFHTLEFIIEGFIEQYIALRYEQTNSVVEYFERELEAARRDLNGRESALMQFNIDNSVINYEEQTKTVVDATARIDNEIEDAMKDKESADKRMAVMEERMGMAAELFLKNSEFINQLHNITDMYTNSSSSIDERDIAAMSAAIDAETDSLRRISSKISNIKFTKEGIAIQDITEQWLNALIDQARATAILNILKQARQDIEAQYAHYSPIGSSIKRQNREIDFSERNYLTYLQALNEAKLRQKNLQLSSATFKTLTPPTVAQMPEKTKRRTLTILSFVLALILMATFIVFGELMNRKPYEKAAAERIIHCPAIGAYPVIGTDKYDDLCDEFARNQLGNAIVAMFDRSKSNNVINIMSIERGEGKTFICESLLKYFQKLDTSPIYVSWNKDFDSESKYYMLASSIYDFAINEDNVDDFPKAGVTIVEHPPLSANSFPFKLLDSAVNILVVDADRSWKGVDQILLKQLKDCDKNAELFVCLNGASRDAVGTFTGMLPPYTDAHRFSFYMSNLGNVD